MGGELAVLRDWVSGVALRMHHTFLEAETPISHGGLSSVDVHAVLTSPLHTWPESLGLTIALADPVPPQLRLELRW